MVIDTFMFLNEFELLDIRVNHMNPWVDRFLVVEAPFTHQLNYKPYNLEPKLEELRNENHAYYKVLYFKLPHELYFALPKDSMAWKKSPWYYEWMQRQYISEWILNNCADNDYVIFGDIDELPTPVALNRVLDQNISMAAFYMTFYIYELNRLILTPKGDNFERICTIMGKAKYFKERVHTYGIASLRHDLKNKQSHSISRKDINFNVKTFDSSGWHFTSIGSWDQVKYKYENFTHAKDIGKDDLKEAYNKCQRPGSKLKTIITDIFNMPDYVKMNEAKFKEILAK